MKIIKFRGKDLDDGEWVYGCVFIALTGKYYIFEPDITSASDHDFCETEVDPETVGQFTGAYDIKGNEIYEGDIVSWLCTFNDCGMLEVGKIEYKREETQFIIVNRFSTKDHRESICTIQNRRDLIVRGNIYDNPGIMKGEKE